MTNRNKVWVGFHPARGILIYDPQRQYEVPESHVRLFVLSERHFRIFHRATLREGLRALADHLTISNLGPLQADHEVVSQIAKLYLQCRPELESLRPAPSSNDADEPDDGNYYADLQKDDEHDLIVQELMEDADAWARSDESGWFYEN